MGDFNGHGIQKCCKKIGSDWSQHYRWLRTCRKHLTRHLQNQGMWQKFHCKSNFSVSPQENCGISDLFFCDVAQWITISPRHLQEILPTWNHNQAWNGLKKALRISFWNVCWISKWPNCYQQYGAKYVHTHCIVDIRKYQRFTKCVWNLHWEILKTQKNDWSSNAKPGSAQYECMGTTVKKGVAREQTWVTQ